MAKTTYVWDELSDNVIDEYEDGVLSASYTHEPGLYGNLLSQNRNGVTSYYHYDGRGDTIALTDDAGNVTDTKEYDAWGNVIASSGSTVMHYQFGGMLGYTIDQTVQLHYIRRRFFKATAARWISDDPIRVSPTHMDQFVYANNRPLSMSDPSGLIVSTVSPTPTVWSCGTSHITTAARFSMHWDISLDNPAPCDGWFVQQIVAWIGVTECPIKWPFLERDCCHPPSRRDYWGVNAVASLEAHRVAFNSRIAGVDNWRFNRIPFLKGSFAKYCGEMTIIAKGRFFCERDTGDLNVVWKNKKPGEGAGNHPAIETTVGNLPSWWNKAVEIEAQFRQIEFHFDCCEKTKCCPGGAFAQLSIIDGDSHRTIIDAE